MISKSYSVFCDKCTKTEQLFSSNMRDCENEARRLGWKKYGKEGKWECDECQKEDGK